MVYGYARVCITMYVCCNIYKCGCVTLVKLVQKVVWTEDLKESFWNIQVWDNWIKGWRSKLKHSERNTASAVDMGFML